MIFSGVVEGHLARQVADGLKVVKRRNILSGFIFELTSCIIIVGAHLISGQANVLQSIKRLMVGLSTSIA